MCLYYMGKNKENKINSSWGNRKTMSNHLEANLFVIKTGMLHIYR